jgi:hypothetical protein
MQSAAFLAIGCCPAAPWYASSLTARAGTRSAWNSRRQLTHAAARSLFAKRTQGVSTDAFLSQALTVPRLTTSVIQGEAQGTEIIDINNQSAETKTKKDRAARVPGQERDCSKLLNRARPLMRGRSIEMLDDR